MQHKSKPPITYNVLIESEKRQVTVDWGKEKHWMETYRDDLDNAHRISLLPKPGQVGPMVTVFLDGDKKWVIGSRVHGSMTDGSGIEFRIYFIGWQRTIWKEVYDETGEPVTDDSNSKENIKVVHWVYPGGAVECSPEPTLVGYFMEHFKKRLAKSK